MRIGSFFLILLATLVALGYLLSDSIHLREDMSNQQKEIERLTQSLQQTGQEKQNALTALQSAEGELRSCQQTVEQSRQYISQITDENTLLKSQNQLLTTAVQSQNKTDSSARPRTEPVQATTFSFVAFIALGVGSIITIGLKRIQKWFREDIVKTGHYIYLTNAEISEIIQQRRRQRDITQ